MTIASHTDVQSKIPRSFLEAYPHPAFVLVVPSRSAQRNRPPLVSRDTDITVRDDDVDGDISPLGGPSRRPFPSDPVVWGNTSWYKLMQGRNFEDCLEVETQNRLQSWVEEASVPTDDVDEEPFVMDMISPPTTLLLAKTFITLSSTQSLCVVITQKQLRQQVASVSPPLLRGSYSMDRAPSTSSRYNHRQSDAMSSTTDFSHHRLSSSSAFGSSSSSPPRGLENRGPYFASSSGSERPHSKTHKKSAVRIRSSLPKSINVQAKECWDMVESIDWARTSVGLRHGWKAETDPVLSITFESKTQDCVWLGPDLLLLYNAAYSELTDHPASFGKPGRQVWADVWDYLGPIAENCMNGMPFYKEDDGVFYRRYGKYDTLRETYFSWRYVPIMGRDGGIRGIYNTSLDRTQVVLLERRSKSLRDLSEEMLVARNTAEYFEALVTSLEGNPADVPFVAAYRVKQVTSDATHDHTEATLTANIGVPQAHSSAPADFKFSVPVRNRAEYGANTDRISSPTLSAISSLSISSWPTARSEEEFPILQALTTRRPVIVEDVRELIKGYPIRHWDELPVSAVVMPICSEGALDLPELVMIFGLNARSPLDAPYEDFLRSVRAQLASSWNSTKASEMEQKMHEDNLRMEKAKQAWLRGACHDLRSPLTLISGPLAELADASRTLTSTQRHLVNTAQRNVDRLMRLVDTLMDFSRVEAGHLQGRFVPTDLGEFVSTLAAVFRPAVERLKINFVLDIQPSDLPVHIDPNLMETVISNLIGNALKYTAAGTITVSVKYTEEVAQVAVSDTGVGIPQDEISLVTHWYHRASTVVHSGPHGSGLGLALAKELLGLHQGELIVESRMAAESDQGQHGSTFTAVLPLWFKPPPPADPAPTAKLGSYGQVLAAEAMRWNNGEDDESSENLTDTTPSKFGARDSLLFDKSDVILVVDDNRDMRDFIKKIFSPHCTVIQAADGQAALDMAIRQPPDLILSDLVMPIMGGMELLAQIREHPATRLVPVVLVSAVGDETAKTEALLNGAEDYMAKPFQPKELFARVHLQLQVGKKRINLEKLFSEREAESAVLSDCCPSGIIRADEQGRLIYANAAWREQSGVTSEDVDNWPSFVDDVTQERLQRVWGEYLQGRERDLKLTWQWNNGNTVSGLFIRLDLVHPGSRGILGCTTDISHEIQRLIEAEERRKEAEESKHQQELLIDLTSHEIRTPVSAILQCSSLVKENLVALKDELHACGDAGFFPSTELLGNLEEDVEALESIYQCGLVQERIAGDVLSLARIQLDMLSLHDIEVDLRKEARKVLSVFASEAKMKRIELDLVFGKTVEQAKVLSIKTDPVRLGQVVTNLINNAIRFTASADIRKITVQYDVSFLPPMDDTCSLPEEIGLPSALPAPEDTPIWLLVSVTDTGAGMNSQELSVLFQRFAQGNKAVHTKYGGSGLGLFICRKITELLGGRIEVLSQPGQGSVFRFFIRTRTVSPSTALAVWKAAVPEDTLHAPLTIRSRSSTPSLAASARLSVKDSRSPSAPAIPRTGGDEQGASPTSSLVSGAAENIHILIVEDNIINQTVLKRQMVKAGLTCDVANNGLEALDRIHQSQSLNSQHSGKAYDVVLMDLEMPVMDGLTAIRELRALEKSGELKKSMVVALTGNARQGQIDQALAEGMDDVVIKPYVLKDLLDKIRNRASTSRNENGNGGSTSNVTSEKST